MLVYTRFLMNSLSLHGFFELFGPMPWWKFEEILTHWKPVSGSCYHILSNVSWFKNHQNHHDHCRWTNLLVPLVRSGQAHGGIRGGTWGMGDADGYGWLRTMLSHVTRYHGDGKWLFNGCLMVIVHGLTMVKNEMIFSMVIFHGLTMG